MILNGTTADKMRGIYSRPHRVSIYEPATIHDMPFEVLRESFLYLISSDIISASLACRAWRAVAFYFMNYRKEHPFISFGEKGIVRLTCGLLLRSIVGLERCTIKHLELSNVGSEYIILLAQLVAPTLSSLDASYLDSMVYFHF
jgi:hypothetical protein